jgi:tetratricopeptide (TPR) repeat protein
VTANSGDVYSPRLSFTGQKPKRHEALELDPNSPQAHVWLGISNVARVKFEPAIAALQKAVELSQRTPVAVARPGEAYAAAGSPDEAQKILHELTGHRHVTAYFVGRI